MVWSNGRVAHVRDVLLQGTPSGSQLEKLQAQPHVYDQEITHTLISTIKHYVFHCWQTLHLLQYDHDLSNDAAGTLSGYQ